LAQVYVVTSEELSAGLAAAISDVARMLIREGVHVNRTALSVLGTLREGPRRITDLAADEYVSQPGMTNLVSRLESEGWVVRRPDPTDGRAVRVAITTRGVATFDAAIAARTEAVRTRVERLGPKEQKALARAVDALRLLTQDD
jgi:DNA-binding MarR family transcriptional regulator